MEGRYYEDIQIGERHITPERTITETDIVNFVALAGLTEPIFRSVEYAKKHSMFKARIVQAFLQKRSPQFQKPESRQHKEES